MNKKTGNFTLFMIILMITGACFFIRPTAADATDEVDVNGATLHNYKEILAEYSAVYFKRRMALCILNDKTVREQVIKTLSTSTPGDINSDAMLMIRDFFSYYARITGNYDNFENWLSLKLPLLVNGLYNRISGIYQQKMDDLGERLVNMAVNSITKNNTQALAEFIAFIKKYHGYQLCSISDLLEQMACAMRFQMNSNPALNIAMNRNISELENIIAAAGKVKISEFDKKFGEKIMKMKAHTLWALISRAILFEIVDMPSNAERIGKLDINKISAGELVKIPGVTNDIADKIVGYREANKAITSVHELDMIGGIGPKIIRLLKTCLYAGDFKMPEKDWTVICYMNGDSNIEVETLLGINNMECVGSTDKMNVVVQLDRVGRGQINPAASSSDTAMDGNWTTARRYLIQKDRRPFEINSIMLEKMGEVDMGDADNFTDFCKYAVTHFPAKHYAVVIMNHGAEWGIGGISFDDTSKNNYMDTIQLGNALRKIRDLIKEQNGNDVIDALMLHCCHLSKIEVMKEISDSVKGVYACEDAMLSCFIYDRLLSAIDANSGISGPELARIYQRSYINFLKDHGYSKKYPKAAAAYDLTKYKAFDGAFDKFTRELGEFTDSNFEDIDKILAMLEPLSQSSVYDLANFVGSVRAIAKDNKKMSEACDNLLDAFGKPVKVETGEVIFSTYSGSGFLLQEAHTNLEPTAHGLSITIMAKPVAKKIWPDFDDEKIIRIINNFKNGFFYYKNYMELKLSRESGWDEFLTKIINMEQNQ